jgi:hypothetical protein
MLRRLSLVLILVVFSTITSSQPASSSKSRHFIFDYSFTVRITDPGKPLDVWFPMAHSDRFQQVRVVSVKSDLPLRQTTEPQYGNRIFYAHTERVDKSEYHFSVKYDVVRWEHLAAGSPKSGVRPAVLKQFLQPDRLIPVSGKPAEIAAEQVQPGMSDVQKGRALYDYTFDNMRYDKSGSGWGRGDALWACDSHHGNCTDFHSLFISMARSQHIPARFEIGFAIPESKAASDIAGYHCWAEFYTPEYGWFPVDVSEAWQQHKKEYFFGAHDANRVQFTVGRDLELSPSQHGERLNYFIYPYAELNGKEYPNIAIAFAFANLRNGVSARPSRSQGAGK